MAALSNIRRHPHIAETVAYLKHCGADDIVVEPGKRTHIRWRINGRRKMLVLSAATRRCDEIARTSRQMVRRKFREAGVEVRA